MGAAMKGHFECVKLLVFAGADITAVNDDGESAADLAAANGHTTVADYLRALQ